jgi:uncharacterized protein
MIRLRQTALSLLACGTLFSCSSSPPTRFYMLSTIAPQTGGQTAGASAAQSTVAVRVEAIAIPAELDRLELVHHSGANQVQITDVERWAAPLDEQIRRTLSDDLAARLAPGSVADPNEPSTQDPRRTLSVSIGQFDADAGCVVTLNASWSLQQPHIAARTGSEHIRVSATGTCPSALPAAMSQALGMLADRLAPALAQ